MDAVSVPGNPTEMMMFLGEWFDGYYEFHISGRDTRGQTEMVLWDMDHGHKKLPQDIISSLFRKSAEILTLYYNLQSFEQICAWHHGAGDFIIKLSGKQVHMKLISVREYTTMADNTLPTPETMVHALLLFVLNLSMRMRVDRVEGVGDLIWADDRAVVETIYGFCRGMSRKARIDPLAEPLMTLFKEALRSCTTGDLIEVAAALVDSYNPQAPETELIREHLKEHCSALCNTLRNCIY
jgi:hypothetical protein